MPGAPVTAPGCEHALLKAVSRERAANEGGTTSLWPRPSQGGVFCLPQAPAPHVAPLPWLSRRRVANRRRTTVERVRTTEAASQIGRQVRLQGWLHQFRELGKINFLIIRDGWGTFQAVVEEPAALEALRAVQVESVIEVCGVVVAEAQAPGG